MWSLSMVSMQSLQAAKISPHGSPLRSLAKEKVFLVGVGHPRNCFLKVSIPEDEMTVKDSRKTCLLHQ